MVLFRGQQQEAIIFPDFYRQRMTSVQNKNKRDESQSSCEAWGLQIGWHDNLLSLNDFISHNSSI